MENTTNTSTAFTPEEILKRIDAITADTAHISKALDSLSGRGGDGGYSVGSLSHSIATVVEARETTNQQLIGLLTKMFDSTQPPKPERGFMETQIIRDLIELLDDDDAKADVIKEYMRSVRGNSAQPPVSVHNHYNGDGNGEGGKAYSFPFGNRKGKNGAQTGDNE